MNPAPLLLLLAACGGGASEPLTVATFNAGLARGFVPATESRAPQAAEAVANLDADVVCLQEVWEAGHVQMFEDAASASFPNTYFPDPEPVTEDAPACAEGELDELVTCVNESCSDVCDDKLVDCMFENCGFQFLWLAEDPTCIGCVMANVGSTPDEIEATCTQETTLYAYGGSYGTGLLSAHEIASVEHHIFESTTNRRGVIHAVVDDPGGPTDVYCTHLTAVFDVIPYPREEGSWEEEQAAQIGDLLAFVDESAETDRVVIMGDLNTGPAIGDAVVAEQPDNWALLAQSGMATPYIDEVGECTYCPDNPLVGGEADERGAVIDHVLVEGVEGAVSAERVLDGEITAERCDETIPAALSDHYGVRVTFSPDG